MFRIFFGISTCSLAFSVFAHGGHSHIDSSAFFHWLTHIINNPIIILSIIGLFFW